MNQYRKFRSIKRVVGLFLIIAIAMNVWNPIQADAKSNQAFEYNEDIPMSKKVQEYLYNKVTERKLDYEETLATIYQESSFRSDVVASKNYGYFQINKVNHASLSKNLKTENKPLDPYVNIDWGTYMLSNLYNKYTKDGLKGRKLKEAVLSAYNKGETGYKRTGKATKYIEKHDQSLKYIQELME